MSSGSGPTLAPADENAKLAQGKATFYAEELSASTHVCLMLPLNLCLKTTWATLRSHSENTLKKPYEEFFDEDKGYIGYMRRQQTLVGRMKDPGLFLAAAYEQLIRLWDTWAKA